MVCLDKRPLVVVCLDPKMNGIGTIQGFAEPFVSLDVSWETLYDFRQYMREVVALHRAGRRPWEIRAEFGIPEEPIPADFGYFDA
jgi:hypothetical protein